MSKPVQDQDQSVATASNVDKNAEENDFLPYEIYIGADIRGRPMYGRCTAVFSTAATASPKNLLDHPRTENPPMIDKYHSFQRDKRYEDRAVAQILIAAYDLNDHTVGRSRLQSADFIGSGDIRLGRKPCGEPAVVRTEHHGDFFVAYGGCVALWGVQFQREMGLNHRRPNVGVPEIRSDDHRPLEFVRKPRPPKGMEYTPLQNLHPGVFSIFPAKPSPKPKATKSGLDSENGEKATESPIHSSCTDSHKEDGNDLFVPTQECDKPLRDSGNEKSHIEVTKAEKQQDHTESLQYNAAGENLAVQTSDLPQNSLLNSTDDPLEAAEEVQGTLLEPTRSVTTNAVSSIGPFRRSPSPSYVSIDSETASPALRGVQASVLNRAAPDSIVPKASPSDSQSNETPIGIGNEDSSDWLATTIHNIRRLQMENRFLKAQNQEQAKEIAELKQSIESQEQEFQVKRDELVSSTLDEVKSLMSRKCLSEAYSVKRKRSESHDDSSKYPKTG